MFHMPIECNVSNSTLNSVKRVKNDAAVKAETWLKDFGTTQVVPVEPRAKDELLPNDRSANITEQRSNNKIIHPDADYIGPESRSFVTIAARR